MQLSYSEISGWQQFENLVEIFFKDFVEDDDIMNVTHVESKSSGVGSDGGKDILVTMLMSDGILNFERKWVVQCKFLNRPVNKSDIFDVNIPTLIHEYGADGYILVCSGDITAPLASQFENLNNNCNSGYKYEIWKGEDFKRRLLKRYTILEQFFPDFYQSYPKPSN